MSDRQKTLEMLARCFAHQHPEEFNRGWVPAETFPENTAVDEAVGAPEDRLA